MSGDIRTGTISITGLADLERRLKELPDKLAKNVLRGAIRAGAVVIQKEAKRLAPMSAEAHMMKSGVGRLGTWVRPGNLKKNIKVKSAKSNKYPVTYEVYISGKAWYGKFLEIGTSKMDKQQFMRPAFDTQKKAATVVIRDYMAARIDKELAKNGR